MCLCVCGQLTIVNRRATNAAHVDVAAQRQWTRRLRDEQHK